MEFFEKPQNKHRGPVEEASDSVDIKTPKEFSYDDLTGVLNEKAKNNTATYEEDQTGKELLALKDDLKRIKSIPVVRIYNDLDKRRSNTKEDIRIIKERLNEILISEDSSNIKENDQVSADLRKLDLLEKSLPRYEYEADKYMTENSQRLEPFLKKEKEIVEKIIILEHDLDNTYKKEKQTYYN